MDTLSTIVTSNPIKLNCSSFKTIYSTILCIATFSSLLVLRYSPLVLWITANAIIFSVYKLSSSRFANYSDPKSDLVHPILASIPSDGWHDHYPSSHAELEPTEKEVTYVETDRDKDKKLRKEENLDDTRNTVRDEDMKLTKEENSDGTSNTIMMRRSGATTKKPSLKKSGTWERSNWHLQRADEVRHKRELKKSATYKDGSEQVASHNQHVEEKTSKGDTGWRTREVLVVPHDDLFRRVENFIKKQHENLCLQLQEADYSHFLEYSGK